MPIILFDGQCNLCNKSVQFILKHERNQELQFVSLQSEQGTKILSDQGYPENYTESVLFLKNNKLYKESKAALKISAYLKFPWNALRVFYIVPTFLRNWVYRYIAKNRLHWFGKTDSCWVMTPEYKSRFLN
jgi:predicted DCC family thiol-disulfide oxidoreductase YuxK